MPVDCRQAATGTSKSDALWDYDAFASVHAGLGSGDEIPRSGRKIYGPSPGELRSRDCPQNTTGVVAAIIGPTPAKLRVADSIFSGRHFIRPHFQRLTSQFNPAHAVAAELHSISAWSQAPGQLQASHVMIYRRGRSRVNACDSVKYLRANQFDLSGDTRTRLQITSYYLQFSRQ
jgi:hypothetical protein